MGQYYLIVNIDKRQYLKPHYFGDGAKLMEFGMSSSGVLAALAVLLSDGNGRGGGDLASTHPIIGTWAGDRVVITGDYADEGAFIPDAEIATIRADNEARYSKLKASVMASHEDKRWCEWWEKYGSAGKPNLYTVASETYKDVSDEALGALMDDSYACQALRERTSWRSGDEAGPNFRRLHGTAKPDAAEHPRRRAAKQLAAKSTKKVVEAPAEPAEDLPESPFDI